MDEFVDVEYASHSLVLTGREMWNPYGCDRAMEYSTRQALWLNSARVIGSAIIALDTNEIAIELYDSPHS